MLRMAVRIGYKASAEQFDPVTLLDFAVEAERRGLEIVRRRFRGSRRQGSAPGARCWARAC
jgi:coenzyme F420-dependent glucose-6-phosphate dehydrogenase